MSGLTALKSKIKSLQNKFIVKPRLRSVLTFSEYEEIVKTGVIPDDVHWEGILLVPDKMTDAAWEDYCSKEMG